jgi:hypothetical protein
MQLLADSIFLSGTLFCKSLDWSLVMLTCGLAFSLVQVGLGAFNHISPSDFSLTYASVCSREGKSRQLCKKFRGRALDFGRP